MPDQSQNLWKTCSTLFYNWGFMKARVKEQIIFNWLIVSGEWGTLSNEEVKPMSRKHKGKHALFEMTTVSYMGPRGGHWFCFFCISPVLIYPPTVSTSAATCYVSAVGSDSAVVAGELTHQLNCCAARCVLGALPGTLPPCGCLSPLQPSIIHSGLPLGKAPTIKKDFLDRL